MLGEAALGIFVPSLSTGNQQPTSTTSGNQNTTFGNLLFPS